MKLSQRIFNLIALGALLVGLLNVSPARAAGTTITVTNTNNSGAGSLRQALIDANYGDVIDATGISGTITLASSLLVNDDVTINGPGAASLTISGNHAVQVIQIDSLRTVTIKNMTFANGKATGYDGGGVVNYGSLTLNGVTVTNNATVKLNSSTLNGGGIFSGDNSTLMIYNSTVSNNTTVGSGGGVYASFTSTVLMENVIIDNNHATDVNGIGGGIVMREPYWAGFNQLTLTNNSAYYSGGGLYTDGSFAMSNSLIANNATVTNQTSDGHGGGLTMSATGGTYSLINVTITGNSAHNAGSTGRGGGVVLWSGTLNLTNVTIAGNVAQSEGGGLYAEMGGSATVNLTNSILSNNTGSSSTDCYGELNSLGYNLVKNATCTLLGNTTGNLTGVDPKLGTLANNGGPTKTLALLAGSPAINKGTNTNCPTTDQRGVTRPFGGTCDMGAYEVNRASANLKSVGVADGWILETGEVTGVGGTVNTTGQTFNLGDDATKKQYRAILSFTTGKPLPDNAVITKVTIKIKSASVTGSATFAMFQGLLVDLKKGYFGVNGNLAAADFQAATGATGKTYGPVSPPLVGGWYSLNLTTGKAYINKLATLSGLTQIRLRFKLDDNNDATANYMSFSSGNATSAANRPTLTIEYYVP